MIDNPQDAHALIEALKQHLPMRAYATAPLVEVARQQGADIKLNDPVKIDSLLYLGDTGGIACPIRLSGGKTVVVMSLTHLRIDRDHPLASRIQAYQLRRSQLLARPAGRTSRVSRASVATKPKRKTAGIDRKEEVTNDDPTNHADPERLPRRFPQDELRALPLGRDTWQVGLVPCREQPQGEHMPMWLFGVANVRRPEFRAATIIDQPLTEVVVWNQLIESFLSPMDGAPARPGTLIVCRREFLDAWKPLLSKLGVRCRYEKDPQPVGRLLEAMGDIVKDRKLPSAKDVDIRELPQSDEVWQADFILSPAWVKKQGGAYRPWSMLVLEKSRSQALTTSHTPGDPAPEMLLEFLVRTMARPGGQAARRPRLVEVSDSDCYDHLRPRLEAAGIVCRLVDELSELNDFCLRLARSMEGSGKCALADGQGVTRAQMESFYEAADYYFREAPWCRLPGEVPIEVRCDDPPLGTRYAIVLGRTGVQLGLCVYDDWETAQAMLCGYAGPDENRALAVCYDEPLIMAAVDLQLIERLGWPISAPEAWPAAMRLAPRHTPRSPSAEQLVFLDACLRAIPNFLKTGASSQTRQVETLTRPVELHLAWKE